MTAWMASGEDRSPGFLVCRQVPCSIPHREETLAPVLLGSLLPLWRPPSWPNELAKTPPPNPFKLGLHPVSLGDRDGGWFINTQSLVSGFLFSVVYSESSLL